VHTADLHLDCPFEGLGLISPDLASILREATFTSLNNLIDLCIARKADFLVIAGDIYNSQDKSLRAQLCFHESIGRLSVAGIRSYIACGNHDPVSGWSARLDWPDGIHFFSTDPESAPVIRDGVEIARIYGISHAGCGITENLALSLAKENNSPFSIAVLHCNCGQPTSRQPYSPCSIADLERSGIDYWALGHIHKCDVLRDGSPVVVYPGNIQGLNPKETGAKGCYVVSVDDADRVNLEFVETNSIRWFDEEISISGFTREQELIDGINDKIEQIRSDAHRPSLVRFRLTGRTELHRDIVSKSILEDITASLRDKETLHDNFVWVESIRNETGPDIDIDERIKSEDFIGDLLRMARDIREDPEKLESLRTAIEPLFDHTRARQYLAQPESNQLLEWLDAALVCGLDSLIQEEAAQ
jgi:exonuclease SbcD